jgi:hypothetical protein
MFTARLLSPSIAEKQFLRVKEMAKDRGKHLDQPTYWFAVLEIARERDDFEQAAEAKRNLERLGVHVSYERGKTSERQREAAR